MVQLDPVTIATDFENLMREVEDDLTAVAYYPIVGTAAAVLKVAMGILQTLGGLFLWPVLLSRAPNLRSYAQAHIRNGMGNVAAGLIEAIPIVGTCAYYVRKWHSHKEAENFTSENGERTAGILTQFVHYYSEGRFLASQHRDLLNREMS